MLSERLADDGDVEERSFRSEAERFFGDEFSDGAMTIGEGPTLGSVVAPDGPPSPLMSEAG